MRHLICPPLCALPAVGLLLAACPSTTVVVGGSSESAGETSAALTETTATDTGDVADVGDVGDDHRTFFIGESTKFDGGGFCDNAPLNTATHSLRDELVDAGWAGLRFVDENTWPEDFSEGTFLDTFLDGIYGDTAKLAVYAGHGNVGLLQWGQPSDNGRCTTTINLNSRLGSLAGDTAAAAMFMTSCTMREDKLWTVFKDQAARQFFGYHDSPYIGHDEARKVFTRTQDGQATSDAWLEEMVVNGGGKTSPLVLTKGTSPDEAASVHDHTNLATGEGFIANVGEPADSYYYELYDSGCTVKCGNCTGNSTVPPGISAPLPRVTLTRPVRSADNLVDLTTTMLTHFDVGPLDAVEQARLVAWADAIATTGDVRFAVILDQPRIDISYDPSSDFLRITNRDALVSARPGPGTIVDDPADLQDTLRLAAEAVRDELQTLPGALDLLGNEFELTTRKLGYFDADTTPSASIAFEYVFTLPGQFQELALPDRSLGIGITRLGELSTLTMADVELEQVGEVGLLRWPQQAVDALTAELLAQYPSAAVEIVAPRLGYQLTEKQGSGELVPSLLVAYVLAFGTEPDIAVSRRYPVRISLVEPDAPIESLAAEDPNPSQGDARAAN